MSFAKRVVAGIAAAALVLSCLPVGIFAPQEAKAASKLFSVADTSYGILNQNITGKQITLADGVEAVQYEDADDNDGRGFLVLKSTEGGKTNYSIVNAKGEVAKTFENASAAPEFKRLISGGRDAEDPDAPGPYWDTLYAVHNTQQQCWDIYNATRGTYISYGCDDEYDFGTIYWDDAGIHSHRRPAGVYYTVPGGGKNLVACDGTKLYEEGLETGAVYGAKYEDIVCKGITESGIAIYQGMRSGYSYNVLTSNGTTELDSKLGAITNANVKVSGIDSHNIYGPNERPVENDGNLIVIESDDYEHPFFAVINVLTGDAILKADYELDEDRSFYAGNGVYAVQYDVSWDHQEQYIVSPKGCFNCKEKLNIDESGSVELLAGEQGRVCLRGSNEGQAEKTHRIVDGTFNMVDSNAEGYGQAYLSGNVAVVVDGEMTLEEGATSKNFRLRFLDGTPESDIGDIAINLGALNAYFDLPSYSSLSDCVRKVSDGFIVVSDVNNKHYLIDTVKGKILLEDFATQCMHLSDTYRPCWGRNGLVVFETGDEDICAADDDDYSDCKWGIVNLASGAFTGYKFSGHAGNTNSCATVEGIGTADGALWLVGSTLYNESGEVVKKNVIDEDDSEPYFFGADGHAYFTDLSRSGGYWFWAAGAKGSVSESYLRLCGRVNTYVYESEHDPAYSVIDKATGAVNLVSRDGNQMLKEGLGSLGCYAHWMFYAEAAEEYEDAWDERNDEARTAGLLNEAGAWILQGEYRLPTDWNAGYDTDDGRFFGKHVYPGIDQTLALQSADDERVFYLYDMTKYVSEGHLSDNAKPGVDQPIFVAGQKSALLYSKLFDKDMPSSPEHKFYWDDSWLMADSSAYNSKLAIASMIMAWEAYNNKASNKYKFIKRFFNELHLKDIDTSAYKNRISNDDSDYENGFDLVGYGFGHRTSLDENGDPVELLFVAVRGTPGNDEWSSNANVADSASDKASVRFHEGFHKAEQELLGRLDSYCAKHGIDTSKAHVLISGHSRGAAVANLLAADLQQHQSTKFANVQGFSKERVYAYTFATPAGTRDADATGSKYDNIFNIVNPEDFVPRVPLSAWGFKRYGKTLYTPSKSTEYKKYKTNIARMQELYQENYTVKYKPFTCGAAATDGLIRNSKSIASTIEKFYKEDQAWRRLGGFMIPVYGARSMSFREFFGHLTAYLGRDDMDELLPDLAAIAEDLSNNKTLQAQVLWYFAYYYVVDPKTMHYVLGESLERSCIEHAHTMETYLIWLETLDEANVDLLQMGQKGDWHKVVCYCPVDLYVHDASGTVVARVKDGVAEDLTDDGTAPAVYYDELSDAKCAWVPDEGGYYVTVEPYDTGTMDIAWSGKASVDEDADTAHFNDMQLEVGKSYRIDPRAAGEGAAANETVTVTGSNGEVDADYVIAADDTASEFDIALSAAEGGSVFGGGVAKRGEHVTASAVPDNRHLFAGWYEDGQLIDGAEANYTFRAEADRSLEARFDEKPLPDPCTVALDKSTFTYNGKRQGANVTVKNADGATLEAGYDYTFTSSGWGARPGVYSGTVTFINDYEGLPDKKVSWKILPQKTTQSALSGGNGWLKVSWKAKADQATGYEVQYATSSNFKTGVKTVAANGASVATKTVKGLKAGKKYWVRVRVVNTKSGKVVSSWSNVRTRYAFAPKKVTLKKLKPGKKSMKVTWKKLSSSQASGYEIQYARKSSFKGAKTLKAKKAKTISAKIKKLKSKKKYYVRIRAYKTLGGVKYVGPWSKVKKVKAK